MQNGNKNRNVAVTSAALIVLNETNKVALNPRTSSKELIRAIIPLFGIRWNKEVCQKVGGRDITNLLYRIRNSKLSPSSYQKVSELFNTACSLVGPLPPNWAEWLNIIENFELGNSTSTELWREIVNDIRAIGFESPLMLAGIRIREATQTFCDLSKPMESRLLWQACALQFFEPSDGNLLVLQDASKDAEKLIGKIKGPGI